MRMMAGHDLNHLQQIEASLEEAAWVRRSAIRKLRFEEARGKPNIRGAAFEAARSNANFGSAQANSSRG